MNLETDYEGIAKACGSSKTHVEDNWPAILSCLKAVGIWTEQTAIAALATIAVETAYTFQPIVELGSETYLKSKAYYPFYGRGYVQLTWEKNYRHYGDLLGVNLTDNPNAALEPNTSAAIFALFFKDNKVDIAANLNNWTKVRRIINGGKNNLTEFLAIVEKLKA